MAKSLKNMMGAGIGAGTATLINGTVADGLTATGSGQADALILTNDVNVIGTVPLGTGVRLLANPQPGDETLVTNLGANTLAIYPPLGATISGGPVNLPFSLPTGNTAEFIARNGSANWVALASGGGTPTPTTDLLLGFNVPDIYYGGDNVVESNLFQGDIAYSMPSGLPVDAAHLGSDGQPTGPNAGDTAVRYVFRCAEQSGNANVVLTAGTGSSVIAGTGCAKVSYTDASGAGVFTPSAIQPGGTGWSIDVTPGSSCPKVISAIRVGDSGTYVASFDTHVAQASVAGGPIRSMKRRNVELNEGVTVTTTAGAYPAAVVTAANRSTPTSGNWYGQGVTGKKNDGPPIELDIAMATHANRPLLITLPWNADSTYYDAVGDLFAAASIPIYVEVGNEVWNGSYLVSSQAYYEALKGAMNGTLTPLDMSTPTIVTASQSGTVLTVSAVLSGPAIAVGKTIGGDGIDGNTVIQPGGTGAGGTGTYNVNISQTFASRTVVVNPPGRIERYIQKTIDTMDRIKARYVAAGANLTKFQPCASFQSDALSFYATTFLNYAPPGATALKNHIKNMLCAPYMNQGAVSTASTDATALINAGYDSIDTQIDTEFAGMVAACIAAGIGYGAYEAGPSFNITDAATRNSVNNGAEMYKLEMHYLARAAAKGPNAFWCNFCLPHTDFAGQEFGILKYSGQAESASTPRYTVAKDFSAGKRKLLDLVGSLSATAGDSPGTVMGTLKRRTPGSTITLQSNPGTLAAITDTSAQILQITVAVSPSSAGTVNITVRETDARDPAGFHDTVIGVVVSAAVSGTNWNASDKHADLQISGGGIVLTQTGSTTADPSGRATTTKSSGYFEVTVTKVGNPIIGLDVGTLALDQWAGNSTTSVGYQANGSALNNSAAPFTYSTYTTNDTIGVCLRAGKIYFGKWNGSSMVWQGGSNPSAGTGGITPAGTMSSAYPIATTTNIGDAFTGNFTGPFLGTVPTGVTAWG